MAQREAPSGVIVSIVETFLTGPLSVLLILAATVAGAMAILMTPREEEPQIVVPMADITVHFPGHSPEEVEQLVTTPLERILWQIQGVEHVYSISRRDRATATVRFYVGEDQERAMVRLRDDIDANRDLVPPGVTGWIVEPVKIDDVPIVTLTLYGEDRDGFELRRLAEEMKVRLAKVPDVSLVEIFGGYRREVRIEPGIERMAARGVCLPDIVRVLEGENATVTAGAVLEEGKALRLLAGPALESAEDVRQTVITARGDQLVRIEDVAAVYDGPAEPGRYAHIGFGPAHADPALAGRRLPAVTLAFSKKKGTNAVTVAREVIAAAEELRGTVIPADIAMLTTRNYGRIANEKVNDLLASMAFAIVTVVGLIALTMGWREAVVVGLAVPVSFALALFTNYLFGFTINRVTLFALILSLGLVVDDPITNVDNIQRHILMGLRRPFAATLAAVQEVIPPVIMSTLVIIVSFLPLFFITGMMGPYMGPMAINVPLTVTFSTVCALTFVPWLSLKLLKSLAPERSEKTAGTDAEGIDSTPPWLRRFYRAVVSPFLKPRNGVLLLLGMVVLFLGSGALFLLRQVPLKMLPFDNKSELQLVVEMPAGTSLETTDAVVQELEGYLASVNEVTDFQSYAGWHSPIDFNGLVRHYYWRHGPHQADLRVNLVGKQARIQQSHAIALRLRDDIDAIARKHGAVIGIVEVPPGPPVLSTLTVEVYGEPSQEYDEIVAGARALQERLRAEDPKHIVQIDDMAQEKHARYVFTVDRAKARTHGLGVVDVVQTLQAATGGAVPGVVHVEKQREPVLLRVVLPLTDRHHPERLRQFWCRTPAGAMIQLAELGAFRRETEEQPVYHKDLERVVFVTAECAGRPPGEIIVDMWSRLVEDPLPRGSEAVWDGEGEWQITLRVFRDLGIAFGVALLCIYLLMTVQTESFFMPLIIMSAIPLTVIGIAPGFFLLNVLTTKDVNGYPDPVFFTATAMIGMIALGGIVIRNSIVLIEFVQDRMREGMELDEAILQSGAVRFRPIVLTAATTMLGAWPITLDPIFSGLAWALIFGLFASTVFTLVVIPTVYRLVGPRSLQGERHA